MSDLFWLGFFVGGVIVIWASNFLEIWPDWQRDGFGNCYSDEKIEFVCGEVWRTGMDKVNTN